MTGPAIACEQALLFGWASDASLARTRERGPVLTFGKSPFSFRTLVMAARCNLAQYFTVLGKRTDNKING